MTKPELLREIGIHLKKVVDIYNQLVKNPEAFTPGEIDMMVNNATKIIEFAAVVKHQPATALNSDEQIKLRDVGDKLRVITEQLKTKQNEIEKLQQKNNELEKKVEENKYIVDAFNVDIPEVSNKLDSNSTLAKNDLLNDSLVNPIIKVEIVETIVATTSNNVVDDLKKNEVIKPDPFILKEEKKIETMPKSFHSKYESETEELNKKTVIHSLNESIIDGSKENIAEKMMNSKVKDLKKAIPLHEKFHYTNELFGKNSDHYSQFIEALQTKQTWTEAESVLAQAASMYKWDPENKTALQFIALIQRRFD